MIGERRSNEPTRLEVELADEQSLSQVDEARGERRQLGGVAEIGVESPVPSRGCVLGAAVGPGPVDGARRVQADERADGAVVIEGASC